MVSVIISAVTDKVATDPTDLIFFSLVVNPTSVPEKGGAVSRGTMQPSLLIVPPDTAGTKTTVLDEAIGLPVIIA
jgi:hypothetical protein